MIKKNVGELSTLRGVIDTFQRLVFPMSVNMPGRGLWSRRIGEGGANSTEKRSDSLGGSR